MTRLPNPRLAQQWRQRLEQFDQSELSIAAFCELEGYSQASFYQWRRRLAADATPGAPTFVPVDLTGHDPKEHRDASIEIELPGGARIKIPGGVELPQYRNLITAIVEVTTKSQPTATISGEVNS